jgi:hypothetical protein
MVPREALPRTAEAVTVVPCCGAHKSSRFAGRSTTTMSAATTHPTCPTPSNPNLTRAPSQYHPHPHPHTHIRSTTSPRASHSRPRRTRCCVAHASAHCPPKYSPRASLLDPLCLETGWLDTLSHMSFVLKILDPVARNEPMLSWQWPAAIAVELQRLW